MTFTIRHDQFERIRRIVREKTGIALRPGKEALVKARLSKRLRALNIKDFSGYIRLVQSEEGVRELQNMLEAIATNKTEFFRGRDHYEYFSKVVLPERLSKRMRFWSAGCSTGQEAYSLAIVLAETIPDLITRDILILATDISRKVIDFAKTGIYEQREVNQMGLSTRRKYFRRIGMGKDSVFQVSEQLRGLCRFRQLNLMEPWPMSGRFDAVFCRNVMIYFDKSTQQTLLRRFWEILDKEGYLFVGHSEGLTGLGHLFSHQGPTVYKKLDREKHEVY